MGLRPTTVYENSLVGVIPLFSTRVSAIFMAAKDLRIFQDCAQEIGAKRFGVRRLDAAFVRGSNRAAPRPNPREMYATCLYYITRYGIVKRVQPAPMALRGNGITSVNKKARLKIGTRLNVPRFCVTLAAEGGGALLQHLRRKPAGRGGSPSECCTGCSRHRNWPGTVS